MSFDERYTPQGVSNGLLGLAEMQVPWHSLSTSVRLALLNDTHKVLGSTTINQFVNILWSFAKLGVRWDSDISSDLQSDILLCLGRHISRKWPVYHGGLGERHISSIVYALGGMDVKWGTLSSELRQGLERALVKINRNRPTKLSELRNASAVNWKGCSSMVGPVHITNTTGVNDDQDGNELVGHTSSTAQL